MKKAPKAYKNAKFLGSPAARDLRILSEYLEPKERFRKHKVADTVVFFGSARTPSAEAAQKQMQALQISKNATEEELEKARMAIENSRYYEDAFELARRITLWTKERYKHSSRFIVCTGGGPGIMEAANRGAKAAGGKSIGLNISLPFEQFPNPYVDKELNFEFHYFFMRKYWLVYLAKAMIIFPGGFGTLDELMEVLTLMQTGKVKKDMKVLIYDRKYWDNIINMDNMVKYQSINEQNLKLFQFCESVDEMEQELIAHFNKMDSGKKLLK